RCATGEEGLPEPAMLVDIAAQRPRRARIGPLLERRMPERKQVADFLGGDVLEQFLLAREAAEEGGITQPCRVGDLPDQDLVERLAFEELEKGGSQRFDRTQHAGVVGLRRNGRALSSQVVRSP